MGGPFSLTLSDIYMAKMKDDVTEKYQHKFYKRYVMTQLIAVKRTK